AERWHVDDYFDPDPDKPGKMATRYGGFTQDVDRFDAGLFGITPREAATMDPQQRLLLEVVWEALERAGIAPDRLSGTATGVFVGLCNNDYGHLCMGGGDPARVSGYISTGNSPSVAAGRLSYTLGLR